MHTPTLIFGADDNQANDECSANDNEANDEYSEQFKSQATTVITATMKMT